MSNTPIETKSPLHKAPKKAPKYSKEVKDLEGNNVLCADPNMTRALVALMDLGAVNGGAASHWGGPAAAAEAMSAIHAIMFKEENWFEKYNFVNDIGHAENGIYALRANLGFGNLSFEDLKGFRSIKSKLTGHGESHLYPEGVLLSNGPLSSAVSQAQGLAIADKVAEKKRTTICVMSDGASMEGEAKESFAAISGLASKNKINPFVLVLSDNNTKLSGRIDGDSFDMGPSFEAMQVLGWTTIKVENGNNLQDCYSAMENAIQRANEGRPVFLWLKTTKGFGVKATEESASGGHGFPLKAHSEDIISFVDEIMGGQTPDELKEWAKSLTVKEASSETQSSSSVKKEKMQAGLSRGAIVAKKEGLPVFSISSDLQGSTGMAAFHKSFPESSLDVGIAESNMVSVGAGMSKAGFIPVVDTFAAFGVTKGNLPFIMGALSNCPQIAVFSHAGLQDAADGASHQSLTYMSAMSSIPYVCVHTISSSSEGEQLMYQAIKDIENAKRKGEMGKSYIFFVGRENFPVSLKEEMKFELNKSQVVIEGEDGVIAACGPMLHKAIAAAEKLKAEGQSVTVVNHSCVNNPDVDTLEKLLKSNKNKLITVEDHQVVGGMGSLLIHALKQKGLDFHSHSLGANGSFGQSAYKADELYQKLGLSLEHIVSAFKKL